MRIWKFNLCDSAEAQGEKNNKKMHNTRRLMISWNEYVLTAAAQIYKLIALLNLSVGSIGLLSCHIIGLSLKLICPSYYCMDFCCVCVFQTKTHLCLQLSSLHQNANKRGARLFRSAPVLNGYSEQRGSPKLKGVWTERRLLNYRGFVGQQRGKHQRECASYWSLLSLHCGPIVMHGYHSNSLTGVYGNDHWFFFFFSLHPW